MSATPLIAETPLDDLTTSIASVAPFHDLPEAVLKAIADVSEFRSYGAGEALMSLGQYDGSEFYLIVSGALKASFADQSTGAMLLETFELGSAFGLPSTVASAEDTFGGQLTLTAHKDTDVIAVDAEAFRLIVAQRPSLTRNLMHYFAKGLAGASFQAVSDESSPERRVYAALLEYIERDAVRGDWRISKMPKHRELAEKADVEEAHAAGAIAQLIQDGVAHRDYPGLVIADMAQLNRLSN